MPATLGVKYINEDCELDMLELHYTYDMPDGMAVADFFCPYCGESRVLEEVQL